LAGEMTTYPREIAEQALAHTVGDEVERAYRRGRRTGTAARANESVGSLRRRPGRREQRDHPASVGS
jgi:hypothetical protein